MPDARFSWTRLSFSLSLLGVLAAQPSHATAIYTFTGAPLMPPFTSIAGSFEVATALAGNLGTLGVGAGEDITASVLHFAFSNGVDTFTETNSTFLVEVSTTSDGFIYNWTVAAQSADGGFDLVTDSVVDEERTWVGPHFGSLPAAAANSRTSGWSVRISPVPEPTAAVVFGFGIGLCRLRLRGMSPRS